MEGRQFASAPSERTLDEFIGVADPVRRGIERGTQHRLQRLILCLTGDRHQMATAHGRIGFRLLKGEATRDDGVAPITHFKPIAQSIPIRVR